MGGVGTARQHVFKRKKSLDLKTYFFFEKNSFST